MDGDREDLAEFIISNYLTILVKNSQLVDGDDGDLAKFVKKNASQIMIFLPHYMWRKIITIYSC